MPLDSRAAASRLPPKPYADSPDPASVVQRQFDAYNACDIDVADGDLFGRRRALANFPARAGGGAEAVRGRRVRLQELDLRPLARPHGDGQPRHRSRAGDTRNFPEGIGTIELIAIYEVRASIARGWFKFGEKRMGAPA